MSLREHAVKQSFGLSVVDGAIEPGGLSLLSLSINRLSKYYESCSIIFLCFGFLPPMRGMLELDVRCSYVVR